jgi:choline dehydrogenase
MGSSFDVVIVGAGAAGCVLARRLCESPGRRVLLLEAGPDMRRDTPGSYRNGWDLPDIPTWGYESEPLPSGEPLRLRRGKLLGGTSWLTRFAVRGAAADFDTWAARGNPGWAFDDVLPSFRRLERDLEFGDLAWHGNAGPMPITRYPGLDPSPVHAAAVDAFRGHGFPAVEDHNAPAAVGVGRMPFSTWDGERVTSADMFLSSGSEPPNLTIRPDSPVDRVVLQDRRAASVRLADGTEIAAGWVIIAAGVYGSPTLLMRSGIGPAEHLRRIGINVALDVPGVGSNLADHSHNVIDSGWRGEGRASPVLHSIATFRSSGAPSDAAPDLLVWVDDPSVDDPTLDFEILLMKPDSRGSVRLRSADASAAPLIELPGIREARDIERMAEAYRLVVSVSNSPELRALIDGPGPVDPGPHARRRMVVERYYSIPHTVGTCRMGPSADSGDVVDATGGVHGIDRLSVIDASIIPEPTAGFPHIVTIMLADLLAERNSERW